MTTTVEPSTAQYRAADHTRDYFELSERVKAAGLMGRNVRSYMVRTAILAAVSPARSPCC